MEEEVELELIGEALVGQKVEVRARNVDELFYGALVTGYAKDKETYEVLYEDGTEDAGLRRTAMIVPDSRVDIYADDVVRVLDGHVVLESRIRNARMLAFQESPDLFQTAVAFDVEVSETEDGVQEKDAVIAKRCFDYRALVFDVNQAMMLGLAMLPSLCAGSQNATHTRVCVVGAGGGALPLALLSVVPEIRVDVVELSGGVLECAKVHFGLDETCWKGLHTFEEDGLAFAAAAQPASYDLYYIDVAQESGAEDEEALDLPPPTFLTREHLVEHVSAALRPGGWIIINLCGPRAALLEVLDKVNEWFASVFVFGTDPNYVFFLCPEAVPHLGQIDVGNGQSAVVEEDDNQNNNKDNDDDGNIRGASDIDALDSVHDAAWVDALAIYHRALALNLQKSCSAILGDLEKTQKHLEKNVALGWLTASDFRGLLLNPDTCI
ncbi:Methyltransferase-like protein 13 [Hondaea fermentalgiana]|uniref:Methyltransferase-like protein 13 n=1 Tax=Hondaea fermentalgiana TaxID=2315210 RepID=A0A2R5GLC4_9STRA|nr:Methyltransferase-like protein 13 [Hondaea fermentalgiana]|eukprot:GBG31435.1 Methyltransferase-like protein 13 [Hondaea fermentalgiana]